MLGVDRPPNPEVDVQHGAEAAEPLSTRMGLLSKQVMKGLNMKSLEEHQKTMVESMDKGVS